MLALNRNQTGSCGQIVENKSQKEKKQKNWGLSKKELNLAPDFCRNNLENQWTPRSQLCFYVLIKLNHLFFFWTNAATSWLRLLTMQDLHVLSNNSHF